MNLKYFLLMIALGIVWGLIPSLARLSAPFSYSTLGLAIWVNLVAGALCLSFAAMNGQLPALKMRDIRFFTLWAVVSGGGVRLITLWVAAYVEASSLAVIATLQTFFVFTFAALVGFDRISLRRIIGILIGLAGVVLVMWGRLTYGDTKLLWLCAALLLPLVYAIEWSILATRRPTHILPAASVGLMMTTSAILLLPFTYLAGGIFTGNPLPTELWILVVLTALASAVSLCVSLYIVTSAGAVYSSQSAYWMTIAGVVWGMLLLDEEISFLVIVAIALIIIGLCLVGTRNSVGACQRSDYDRLLLDMVPDNNPDPAWKPQDNNTHKQINNWLMQLEPKHRDVIVRCFGLHGYERTTLEDVARELGVTRERVRQIQMEALKKLRRNPHTNIELKSEGYSGIV